MDKLRLACRLDKELEFSKSDEVIREVLSQIGYINNNPNISYFVRPWSDHAQEFKDSDSKRQKFHQSTIPEYGSGFTEPAHDFSHKPQNKVNVNVSKTAQQMIETISARPYYFTVSLRGCGAQGNAVFDVSTGNKPQGDRQFPINGVSKGVFIDFTPETQGHENGVLDWNGEKISFTSGVKCNPQVTNDKEVDDTSTTIFSMDGGGGVNGPAYVVNDYKSIGMNGGKTGPFEYGKNRTEGVGSWKNAVP